MSEYVGFTTKIRTSPSHQGYLDAGCVMTRSEQGQMGSYHVTEIHFYGPCRLCCTEMRDVTEYGYEDCSLSPYTGSYYGSPDISICTSCAGSVYRGDVDLTGRFAKCAYAHKRDGSLHDGPVSSDWGLAFFEFQGEGSREATEMCGSCMYAKVAHGEINVGTGRPGITDHPFVPRGGAEFDKYYCGCWGWD